MKKLLLTLFMALTAATSAASTESVDNRVRCEDLGPNECSAAGCAWVAGWPGWCVERRVNSCTDYRTARACFRAGCQWYPQGFCS